MKILHVEDDENIRAFVADALKEQAGIEYVGVASAEDGLRLIKNDGIELILLDLKLTGKMQGLDLLNKLSSKSKVIVITASPESVKKELSKKYPQIVIECLLKPFNLEQLISKIKEVMSTQSVTATIKKTGSKGRFQ